MSKDGETLYYLARFERGMNLWSTNLRTRETKMVLALNANSGSLAWDKEQKSLFLLADGAISKIDPASAKRDSVSISGEMVLNVAAERHQSFEHVWKTVKDQFYTAGYHGIDWDGLKPVYAKYLPHVGNNYEFAEMLAEMLGELNISHSGSTYTPQVSNQDETAALGVFPDPAYKGVGIKIEEVDQGRPARQVRHRREAGHDHRGDRRRDDRRRQGPGAVPQPQGGQDARCCESPTATRSSTWWSSRSRSPRRAGCSTRGGSGATRKRSIA